MNIIKTPLAGLLLIEPTLHQDARGTFFESYVAKKYEQHHIPRFVQDNHSRSIKNTLRGLHFQEPNAQGKLVGVTHGTVWDVAVDIRPHSNTFGQWFSAILSDENYHQLYIPPGFAHGFCVLSDVADFYYKCTEYYQPQHEGGIIWNDVDLNIPWPITDPILSNKDKSYLSLKETITAS